MTEEERSQHSDFLRVDRGRLVGTPPIQANGRQSFDWRPVVRSLTHPPVRSDVRQSQLETAGTPPQARPLCQPLAGSINQHLL